MSAIGPEIPPHLMNKPKLAHDENTTVGIGPPNVLSRPPQEDDSDDSDDYTPALPPDLLAARLLPKTSPASSSVTVTPRRLVGPSYPPSFDPQLPDDQVDDSDDDDVGPKPLPAGVSFQETDGVKEFMEKEEKRRKQVEEAAKPETLKRDEWMLVPPTSSDLLGSLDPTKLKARQFSRTAAPAKKVDNSLWTETPAERQQRIADEVSGKKRRVVNADNSVTPEEALATRKKQRRDEEIKRNVEEYTRTVRGSSLIDMHTKASSSIKDNDEEKPLAIWDHGRDMSLGGRLVDDSTRNKMIKDARGLSDRFGTGKSGGFL